MDLIEQAVFTSAQTDRSAGYQVVATSAGVCDADSRELAVWGPSHDAMLQCTRDAVSINFHPLPSGAYCVSRTTPAGCEYSGRGTRVYTQCLIVSPQSLERFANNPFALIRAALADGSLKPHDKVPAHLEPLRLAGRAAPVDSTLLARLAANPGPDWMASLVQAALDSLCIAVAGGPRGEHVIAGLINCLPPDVRTEFAFSTGLKFSPRRPFRVVALSQDVQEQRRLERLYDLQVLDLSNDPPEDLRPTDSWPRFIGRLLKSGRTSLLSHQMSNRQVRVTRDDLHALGLQLMEELDTAREKSDASPPPIDPPSHTAPGGDAPELEVVKDHLAGAAPPRDPDPQPQPAAPTSPAALQRAHRAHNSFASESPAPAAAKCQPTAPSKLLHPENPHTLEMLERLDDLVYEAIAGKAASMEALKAFWPQVQQALESPMLAESREQYLRYALAIWDECLEPDGVRGPQRAVQSLDVLCLLFDEG